MRRPVLLILAACLGTAWPFWPQPAFSHEIISTTVLFDRENAPRKACIATIPLISSEKTRRLGCLSFAILQDYIADVLVSQRCGPCRSAPVLIQSFS